MVLRLESYRYAEDVLQNVAFKRAFEELLDVFSRLPVLRRVVSPEVRASRFPVSQALMNDWLDREFEAKGGWVRHPRIIPNTKLEGDYLKDKVQIEVQFGNMARWTYDVFKFQASYSRNTIEVGVLVVPVRWFAALIGDNIAYFERILRELPSAKLSITIPILVIGLDPEDDAEFGLLKPGIQSEALAREEQEQDDDGI